MNNNMNTENKAQRMNETLYAWEIGQARIAAIQRNYASGIIGEDRYIDLLHMKGGLS